MTNTRVRQIQNYQNLRRQRFSSLLNQTKRSGCQLLFCHGWGIRLGKRGKFGLILRLVQQHWYWVSTLRALLRIIARLQTAFSGKPWMISITVIGFDTFAGSYPRPVRVSRRRPTFMRSIPSYAHAVTCNGDMYMDRVVRRTEEDREGYNTHVSVARTSYG